MNLTRDMYYDELIVPNGTTINTNPWRIFAKTSIDIQAGGIVANNGAAGNSASGFATVLQRAMTEKLGNNAEEVAKVLTREDLPTLFTRSASLSAPKVRY